MKQIPPDAPSIASAIENEIRSLPQEEAKVVRSQLVKPARHSFHVGNTDEIRPFWIVFDEDAAIHDSGGGYLIVYDDVSGEFGLGLKHLKEERPYIFLNLYGTFLETLRSM